MNPLSRILGRRRAYRHLFLGDGGKLSPHAEEVIADLAKFCRLHRSTATISPISRQIDVPATFQAEGRREVLLRILSHLHVSDADLVRIAERMESHD